jgi:hypothetical protein
MRYLEVSYLAVKEVRKSSVTMINYSAGGGQGGKTFEKCVKISKVGQLVSEKYM